MVKYQNWYSPKIHKYQNWSPLKFAIMVPPSCSLKSNAMINEPLAPLQPIQAPKQGQLCLIKGKPRSTVDPTPDHAENRLPAQLSSLKPNMVVTSWHLEILGGTSLKVRNILLTKKTLDF